MNFFLEPINFEDKQRILEAQDVADRLEIVLGLLEAEIEMLQVEPADAKPEADFGLLLPWYRKQCV